MPTNFFSFLDRNDYLYGFKAVEGRLKDVTGDAFVGKLEVWKKSSSEPILVADSVSGIFASIVANYSADAMDYETAVTLLTALENDLPKHFYEDHSIEIERILNPKHYRDFVERNYSFS